MSVYLSVCICMRLCLWMYDVKIRIDPGCLRTHAPHQVICIYVSTRGYLDKVVR